VVLYMVMLVADVVSRLHLTTYRLSSVTTGGTKSYVQATNVEMHLFVFYSQSYNMASLCVFLLQNCNAAQKVMH